MKYKSEIILIFYCCLFFLFIGCDSDKNDWEEALEINKITAYESFIKSHQESEYVKEAKERIETLVFEEVKQINLVGGYKRFLQDYPNTKRVEDIKKNISEIKQKWPPLVRDIETICIEIHRDFPDESNFIQKTDKIPSIKEQLYEVDSLFEFVGINVIGNREEADAIFRIDIKGEAIGQMYGYGFSKMFGTTYYTGATVDCSVSLLKNNVKLSGFQIKGIIEPPKEIREDDKRVKKQDAPFNIAFPIARFNLKMHAMLNEFFNLPPELRWLTELKHPIKYSPIVKENVIYIAGEKDISALSADNGCLKWTYHEGNMNPSIKLGKPVIGLNNIFLRYYDLYRNLKSGIYVLDLSSGRLINKIETLATIYEDPVLNDGIIYVISNKDNSTNESQDGKSLFALDAASGKILWKFEPSTSVSKFGIPTVFNETLFIDTDNEPAVFALDVHTGHIKWRYNKEPFHYVLSGPEGDYLGEIIPDGVLSEAEKQRPCSKIIVHNNIAYVGDSQKIYGIDIATGELKWSYFVRVNNKGRKIDNKQVFKPAFNKDRLIFINGERSIVAIDLKTSKFLWEYNISTSTSKLIHGTPVVLDSHVCFGVGQFYSTIRSKTCAINAYSGKIEWMIDVGRRGDLNYISSSINNDTFITSSNSGLVCAFSIDNQME